MFTPELLGDAVIALGILGVYLLILGVGCLIADFVFPYIPFIERYLDRLPDYDDDAELSRIEQERVRQKVETWKRTLTPRRRRKM